MIRVIATGLFFLWLAVSVYAAFWVILGAIHQHGVISHATAFILGALIVK